MNNQQIIDNLWQEVEIPESRGFEGPPDGRYTWRVDRFTHDFDKKRGEDFFRLDARVVGGQHAGAFGSQRYYVNEKSLPYLKKDLNILLEGRIPASITSFDPSELLDVQFEGTVKTKNGFQNLFVNRRVSNPGPAFEGISQEVSFP